MIVPRRPRCACVIDDEVPCDKPALLHSVWCRDHICTETCVSYAPFVRDAVPLRDASPALGISRERIVRLLDQDGRWKLSYARSVRHTIIPMLPLDEELLGFLESHTTPTEQKESKEYLKCLPPHAYRKTPHWRMKRNEAIRRARFACQLCGVNINKARLEVHHRTYKNVGEERPEDLTVLCNKHHHLFHDYKKGKLAFKATEVDAKCLLGLSQDVNDIKAMLEELYPGHQLTLVKAS